MSTKDIAVLSPEVEALLAEAASNPDSLLLRAPRHPSRAWSYEPVRPTATGLTSLERHLLAAHQSEIAEFLRDECRARLAAVRSPMRITAPNAGPKAPPRPSVEPRERSEHDLGASTAYRETFGQIADGIGVRRDIERLTIEQLAELANRFVPSSSSVLHAGLAAFVRGRPDAAETCFEKVLASSASALHTSAAWSNLGLTWLNNGRHAQAHAAYKRARALRPDNMAAALSDGFISIQLGDKDRVAMLAKELDALIVDSDTRVADEINHELILGRQVGLWSPTSESHAIVRAFADTESAIVRRILHAFALQ
ncbi:MAG: tetratricopeptide repeat protein [Planctomycetes bacterium]|nr:tetratricopeptide repeat protein [Planctomycetota bacterium]